MSKLTLSVDPVTVAVAKRYAARHNTSLSKLVQGFLEVLEKGGESEFFSRLHADLEREGYRNPQGDEEALRKRHLARKYL